MHASSKNGSPAPKATHIPVRRRHHGGAALRCLRVPSDLSQFRSSRTLPAESRSTPSRITLVTPLTFVGDDAALVEALRVGHPGAVAALYDRYAAQVRLTLRSILGPDDEIPDLLQEVFIRALDRIGKLREVDRLGSWLTTMAVFVGRAQIRVRSRRRWLRVFSPERTRARHLEQPPSDARRAVREIYAVLDGMPIDQRMVFVLRHFHGARLAEAAEACETSLATVKRRLAQAEARFLEAVRRQPGLAQWLEEGTRWTENKA